MKKEKQIIVRTSEQEKKAFERAAEVSGLALSAWARLKLRAAAVKDLQEIGEDVPFLIDKKES